MGRIVDSWRHGLFPLLVGLALVGVMAALPLAARRLQAAPAEVFWRMPIQLSASAGSAWSSQLARNPATGDLFAIWTDGGMGDWPEILGRRWDRASGSWTAVENLSHSEWEDRSSMVFFDSRGQGLLIWTRRYAMSQGAPADGTDLLWRAWDGAGWSRVRRLIHRDFFLPGAYGLIPVETPEGVLLFITYNHGYRTTEYRYGAWSNLSPWEYLVFEDPEVRPILAQILLDDDGLFHAAAFGENSSQQGYDRYFYDAYYLTYDGSEWSTPINMSSTDGVADNVGLSFDGQERLHFLWSDPDSLFSSESDKSAIWERVYQDGAWSGINKEVTVYNQDQAIASFALIAGASGRLHLAWSEGIVVGWGHSDLDIYYRIGDGTAWGVEEQIHASATNSRDPSLVMTDHGAALTWQEDAPSGQKVYFSRQANGPLFWIYLPLTRR